MFNLVATIIIPTLALQLPLSSGHNGQAEYHPDLLGDNDIVEWSLERVPNPDATDHFVFETVHSLLQHWPNTRMRNGKRDPHLYLALARTYIRRQVTT